MKICLGNRRVHVHTVHSYYVLLTIACFSQYCSIGFIYSLYQSSTAMHIKIVIMNSFQNLNTSRRSGLRWSPYSSTKILAVSAIACNTTENKTKHQNWSIRKFKRCINKGQMSNGNISQIFTKICASWKLPSSLF